MENSISLYYLIPLLIVGLIGLVWSADRFVEGAAAIADNFGWSPLLIGLTVVSIGTSAPEILVSANAALKQSSGLAVGNALGSNLANIGLVLGVTALICPLVVSAKLARSEVPIMILVTGIAGAVLANSYLGRLESVVLVFCLFAFIGYLINMASKGSASTEIENDVKIIPMPLKKALLLTGFGLVVLIVASRILVWSASGLAAKFGVSDMIIGVTVVAVGTSLPELAASLSGALKGHSELAIGNVLGSNIFNLLAVLPVAGIISPMNIEGANFLRDYGSVLLLSVILGTACLIKTQGGQKGFIGRPMGILFLALYTGYYVWLLA